MANKVPKPSALAPGIYPVIDHATPDIRDTVVYLEVDSRLGNYKQPEYGSKYAGPRGHLRNDPWAEEGTTPEKIGRFDNHELVHVSLADERGMVRWYYARRREEQAFYNWEYSTPGQNSDGYPTYTRTYFVHRDDLADYYGEYPANPSELENLEPSGGKHLSLGDVDPDLSYTPQFYGFEYSDTQIGRVGDENLDALYVLVVRRFELLCDKTTQTESETYGTVTSTVIFDDDLQNSYELGQEYPLESGKYIIDLAQKFIGCSEEYRRIDISTVAIPTLPSISERVDKEFCNITTKRWVDFDASRNENLGTVLPAIGSADPIDSTRIVVDSSLESIGQSTLAVFTVSYGVFPTEPVTSIREDQQYCRINTESYYALGDTTDLPSVGDVLEGGQVVVDATAQDISCGDVRKFSVSTAVIPTPIIKSRSTSDEWCETYTEAHYDLSAEIDALPGLGTAGETGYVVVDAKIDDVGCGELRKSTVTYALVPSEKRTTESEHPEYCTLFSDTFYELDGFELPVQGDTYLGGYVVNAQATDINCGTVRRISIEYITLPTAKRYTHREDDTYCGVETEQFLDLDTYTTPGLGTVYGAGTVIDVSSRDIGCGGITEYSITSGVIPSPKKISIRTDDERCRIQSETFVDVDTYTLPLVDSAHPTDTDLKVVDTNATPLGCRGISNYEITYAVIPSPPRETAREDERWGTVTEYTFYDLEGATALPVIGDTYESQIVISAVANDVNCGSLRRYVVSTATLPTVKRYEHREDDTYCGVETEVFIAIDTYVLPILGSVYGAGSVIDISSQDLNLGGITEYRITSGVVPSPLRVTERTDNEQCRIVTEQSVQLDTFALPAIDTSHATDTELKVVNTEENPLGCRGIKNVSITYAVIPSPPRQSEREDDRWGRVTEYTYYDLEGVTPLASIGSTYEGATVIAAVANDVNCGTLRRYVVSTVTLPTAKRYEGREDDIYCGVEVEVFIDTNAYVLPGLGSVYGSGVVIDITTNDLNLGGLTEYRITSGVVPSPIKVSSRTDNEQCRIVTESFVDVDTYPLPALDSAHSTDAELRVVDTISTPLGCRGISNYQITYAVIPSPPRQSEREDDRWGRVTEYTFYDLEGAAPLPSVGTTYEGQTVVSAVAQDVNCGTLRRYVVSTILLPTPTKLRTSEDERFCLLTTESFFDLSTYVLPSRGAIHNGSPVIDSTSLDINCGGITEYTITTGQVPSPIKTSERTDDDLCRIITESFTNTDTAYTLPTLDSAHPTITGLKVVNTAATPYGCGGIFAYDVTYAQIPSPAKTNLIEDAEYGRVSIDTFYVNDQYVLLSHGAPYGGGHILSAKKDEVNCGTLIKVEYRYVTLPTSKKYVEREDSEFCTLEDEVHYDLDTHVLPVAGSIHTNGSYVLEATAQDIDLGSIRKFSLTTTELPTNTQVSERKDDDMCTVRTESFYHTDTVYVQPAIGSELSTNTLLKCISANKDPYGCGDIYKYTNAYAQIPSPPRSSEYDDPRYCRVSVDTYYDTDGSVTLPAVGDVYGTGKVVEAKAMDVDCDGLRKYEVHYVALPIVNTSESADSTYCTTTKTETYELTATLGSLPGQGTDNPSGQTILEVTRDAIGCGTISKQTEISTTLPSPALITISSDDNFCEIQTKVLYDKSTANFPAIGASGGLGFVIDKRVTPTGCGGVVRHEETTAAVPSPLTTVTNSDNKYCSITEYRQIVLEGSTLDYTIGDTLADSSIVVDYQQRIYKCDQFVIESYKSIDALPTEVKTASYESPDYCDANIDTFFDLSTSQQPIVGASRGTAGQVVVQVTQKPVCGDLVEFEIRYAQIGPAYKKTSEGINDLFCSVSNISYVDKTSDVPGYARGDADPGDPGAVVIEYSTTPLGCGILSRVNYTVGTVPSDLLSGHRINQVTGKLEDFSKKVIKNTAVDTEKKDVDTNGNYTSIQPYGCGLSLAETANIRPFETLEYDTTIQYTFPRVLTRIDLFIWPLKKGGNEIYPQFLWKKIGYSGPVKARVVEEWHLVKPVAQVPIVLMPGVLVYNSPAFRVSSPPCLHGQILFKADYGTNDKKYSYTYNSNWTVPATTYTDWPTQEFLAAWSARPAYGGYVSKSVYITAPTV